MPPTHLPIDLVMRREVLGEPEALIKTDLELLPFGDRDLAGGLGGGAVATREEGAYVLGRGRRRERSLEDAERR